MTNTCFFCHKPTTEADYCISCKQSICQACDTGLVLDWTHLTPAAHQASDGKDKPIKASPQTDAHKTKIVEESPTRKISRKV